MQLKDVIIIAAACMLGVRGKLGYEDEDMRENALLAAQRLRRTALRLKQERKLDL